MIKNRLKELFENRNYKSFMIMFNTYLSAGYGIDVEIIYYYVGVLLKLNKVDEAFKISTNLLRNQKNYYTIRNFAFLFFLNYNLNEAELLLKLNGFNLNYAYLLGKIYLLQGRVSEAKEVLTRLANENECEKKSPEKLKKLLTIIQNNEKYGSFIKTEYSYFLKNGNTLEPGHIIYLKKPPEEMNGSADYEDMNKEKRPYMIWKIEGNTIYMFQVTQNLKNGSRYVLYSHNYLNSHCDRAVKDNVCMTTIDNVLTVKDKVRDIDFKSIMRGIFYRIYFTNSTNEKRSKRKFMEESIGEVQKYNIIKYVDKKTNNVYYDFVLSIKEDGSIEKVEINPDTLGITNFRKKIIKKFKLVYKRIVLSDEEINFILSQIPKNGELKGINGAIINYGDSKYIGIYQNSEYYICIDYPYSIENICVHNINRDEVIKVEDYITEEEYKSIRTLLDSNPEYSDYLSRKRIINGN